MATDVDKHNTPTIYFFKDSTNIASNVNTPATIPFSIQCMIPQNRMVDIFYKQHESAIKFFPYN